MRILNKIFDCRQVLFGFLLFCSSLVCLQAQTPSFSIVNYQIRLKNTNGSNLILTGPIQVRISLMKNVVCYFQETHQINSLNDGIGSIIVGQGISTGVGLFSSLNSMQPYVDSLVFLSETNINGAGFQILESKKIQAVPFALYSLFTLDTISTNQLTDVNLSGIQNNMIFKSKNGVWNAMNDSTSNSNLYSQNSNQSVYSDSAQFANTSVNINVDTAQYSYYTLNSNYAVNANYAINCDTSQFANSALFADSVINSWHTIGERNNPPNYLGTSDAVDFLLKSNNIERVRINNNGLIRLNLDTSFANLNVKGINGLLFQPKVGSSTWSNSVIGPVMMFVNSKASFNMGDVNDNRWQDTSNMAKASFAFGTRVLSDGGWASTVFGDSCVIKSVPPPALYASNPFFTHGWASLALGKNCVTTGTYGISIGYASQALMYRCVSIGYKCITKNESASIAMGYMAEARGSTSGSFGYKTLASGHKSFALGNLASTNGFYSFVYGDASTIIPGDTVKNTANNQFMVRAAGGVVFYSDTFATAGISLASGSGSWSSLSDSTKKTNFSLLKSDDFLHAFETIPIYYWKYLDQNASVTHVGPTAQAFRRQFLLGENSITISQVDADGIVLHLIRAVNNKIEQPKTAKNKLEKLNADVKALNYIDLNERAENIKSMLMLMEANNKTK